MNWKKLKTEAGCESSAKVWNTEGRCHIAKYKVVKLEKYWWL